jgi:imidazolonepropionase
MTIDLVVENIGTLITNDPQHAGPLGLLGGCVLACEGGRVVFAGPPAGLPQGRAADCRVVDARGRLVSPGLVDPHAHPMFGGNRAGEFALRVRGATYAEIQAAGGGIYSTVRATRAAPDAELVEGTLARLERMARAGTVLCEAKSGYSLDLAGEERMLRLYAEVARRSRVRLSPTLLAHVLPAEAAGDAAARAAYVRAFAEELIPRMAAEKLADAVDVYCDAGAFTLAEARTVLEAGKRAGLGLHVHAEQFTHTGATALGCELGAWSADHLEVASKGDVAAMRAAGVVAIILPGAALTLGLPLPPARALLDAGVAVALGTDCNPGSSMTESLPLMMSLGCMQLRMTVEEAWLAVTLHAARALGRDDHGHLRKGARAHLALWDLGAPAELPYRLGARVNVELIS